MSDDDYEVWEWPKTSTPSDRQRTPADIPDYEEDNLAPRTRCWFCHQPAVTIGHGFAVCGGRADGEMDCAERARDLFRRTVQEASRA